MMDFVLIPELFEKVAERVNAVTSSRSVDAFQTFFQYGHLAEVTRKLADLESSVNYKDKKYPLIWLVMDFVEKCGDFKDGYCQLPDIQILIATSTEPNLYTKDRITKTFKPRLIPVYREFINQLSSSGFFFDTHEDYVPHERILRPYWGVESASGNTANIFNDYIDAIQIRKLSLKVNENVCNQFNLS